MRRHLPPPSPRMSNMLIEWLRAGLEKPGKSNTGLAAALGLPQSRVAEMKSGRRKIKAAELNVISNYLEEPVPLEIISSTPKRIQVVGMVGAGAQIFSIDDHAKGAGLDEVDPPVGGGTPSMVALIVRGDSMEPAFSDGDTIFYDQIFEGDFSHLIGKHCVIRLEDGRTFVKRLYKSDGSYVLHSHNAEPIITQGIAWVAKVKSVNKA